MTKNKSINFEHVELMNITTNQCAALIDDVAMKLSKNPLQYVCNLIQMTAGLATIFYLTSRDHKENGITDDQLLELFISDISGLIRKYKQSHRVERMN